MAAKSHGSRAPVDISCGRESCTTAVPAGLTCRARRGPGYASAAAVGSRVRLPASWANGTSCSTCPPPSPRVLWFEPDLVCALAPPGCDRWPSVAPFGWSPCAPGRSQSAARRADVETVDPRPDSFAALRSPEPGPWQAARVHSTAGELRVRTGLSRLEREILARCVRSTQPSDSVHPRLGKGAATWIDDQTLGATAD